MPKGTIYKMRKCELGREATKGTAVAGSQQMAAILELEPDEVISRDDETPLGVLVKNAGPRAIVKKSTNVTLRAPRAMYEQLDWFLGLCLDRPTTAGASPFTHTFDPGVALIADPHSATVRGRWTDGVTARDLRVAYFTGQRLRLRGEESGLLQAELVGFGRAMVAEAISAAAIPATLTPMKIAEAKVFFNDTLALADLDAPAAGVVPLQMKSFDLEVNMGHFPEWNMEGSLDFGEAKEGEKDFSLGMQLRHDATAAAENAAAEDAHAQAMDLRFVTISFTGPGNLKFRIVVAGTHEKARVGPPRAQADGLDLVDYSIVPHHDTTGQKMVKAVITNDDSISM